MDLVPLPIHCVCGRAERPSDLLRGHREVRARFATNFRGTGLTALCKTALFYSTPMNTARLPPQPQNSKGLDTNFTNGHKTTKLFNRGEGKERKERNHIGFNLRRTKLRPTRCACATARREEIRNPNNRRERSLCFGFFFRDLAFGLGFPTGHASLFSLIYLFYTTQVG